ncbi:MAG: holo-ACP synthase [Leptospirales bacterium]|nr:holo-ACP synthase [Leptospirales bacterium]
MLGLGTDVVENDRVEDLYKKHGRRFLERIFTAQEIEYSLSRPDPVPYLSSRFAAKEASVKALCLPPGVVLNFKDISVEGLSFGHKTLVFTGAARARADEMGVRKIHLSMSHARDSSTAVVILED